MLRTVNSAFSFQSSVFSKILLSLLSGVLLASSFSFAFLGILSWLAFLPVFFALENTSLKKACLLFFISGIIFWSGTIYWLAHVTLPGTVVLILYLSLYFAAFGLIIRPFTMNSTIFGLFIIPSIWVLLEYIRSYLFTGFPWALLGYSQCFNLPIIQIADLTGGWGVSFLVIFVNAALVEMVWAMRERLWARSKAVFILLTSVLFIICAYGYFRLYLPAYTGNERMLRVSVIQGNIPQELKWDELAAGYIVNKYLRLSEEAAVSKPDLIVWPEAASPGLFGQDDAIFEGFYALARKIEIPLLLGTVTRSKDIFFNSAILIDSKGEVAGRYDKLHLVPFGEYIPLKKYLPFLETVVPIGDIQPGRSHYIFNKPAKFCVLICFEDLFPELSREFTKRGAQFLVNITNDAWYKKTSAPYQHLQASIFRAVENRRYLVRSANTGISGFISPDARILSLVRDTSGREIFVDGFLTQKLMLGAQGLTFYTRFGDWFIIICLLLAFFGAVSYYSRKR